MKFFKKYFWVMISILIVFLLYFPILKAHFNYEDAMFLGDAAKVLTKGNLKYIFLPWHGNYARFFRQPIFVILYAIFGYSATPYFVLTLIFHLGIVFMTYKLAFRISNSRLISFFSSLLYGIFQVNFEPMIWLSSGIKELPMTLFFLLSLWYWDVFLKKRKKNDQIYSYLFFFFSLSCEFKALLIPLVLFFWEFFLYSRPIFNLKKIFNKLSKYLPFVGVELFWMLTFYRSTFGLIGGTKNISFLLTFPASLPFYFLPTNRVFWIKIYTNAWGITNNHSDEFFLKELGFLILLFLLVVFLLSKSLKSDAKEKRSSKLAFLVLGVFLNYLPVALTVFSGYHTLWQTIAVHWRYYNLASPLAAIMVSASLFWFSEALAELIGLSFKKFKFFAVPFKLKIFPILFLAVSSYFYIEYDRFMLNDFFLKWSLTAKNIFSQIKETIPSFSKGSVLAIEGAEDQGKRFFFEYRYLFENIFAMYADPGNPEYSSEIEKLTFDPKEMFKRKLIRLKYYTNLEDFLVGNYWHIYQEGREVSWMDLNLPWPLPAYDRLFLGSVYGFYKPEKVYVLETNEFGSVVNLTFQRRTEIKRFLKYFCFDNGRRTCSGKSVKEIGDLSVKNTFEKFSATTQKIFQFLLTTKDDTLPEIYNLNLK